MTVAWAGEGLCDPSRLDWWRTDLVDEWELRLQDEIGSDFTINEENSNTLRKTFAEEHPDLVKKLIEAEEKWRDRKRKKEDKDDYGPLFEEDEDL